jgi:hypothetical protein
LKTTIGRCANFCTRMERMLQYINLDSWSISRLDWPEQNEELFGSPPQCHC